MKEDQIKQLLKEFKSDKLSEDEIFQQLKDLPFEDIDFAKIDHHRTMRWGFPEVVFCEGKTAEQVAVISKRITEKGSNLLATRATPDIYDAVKKELPEARYSTVGRVITCVVHDIDPVKGEVIIVTAGTTDIPVATEALEAARLLGLDARLIADVGVAGMHRVMNFREELQKAAIIIVLAGMEGALPSVVAGIVTTPVIAIPTSVGYGTSFKGLTALLSMLNSCVPGIAVMNIDNGFGASFLAFKILNMAKRITDEKHTD